MATSFSDLFPSTNPLSSLDSGYIPTGDAFSTDASSMSTYGMPAITGAGVPALSSGGLFGSGGSTGLGANVGTAQLALGGLGTIANLWGGLQAASLAKKQYNLTKATTQANLANQISSYNTTLADRERSRAVVEGQTSAQQAAYLAANKLPAVNLGG